MCHGSDRAIGDSIGQSSIAWGSHILHGVLAGNSLKQAASGSTATAKSAVKVIEEVPLCRAPLSSPSRDNSILRGEELENGGVAEVFLVIRLLTYNLYKPLHDVEGFQDAFL